MASVNGMTAEAINALMDTMVVSVRVDAEGQMLFKNRAGVEQVAGPVIAPTPAIEKAWPVGSIYMGMTPANPATTIGVGTWTRIAQGRTLVGLDDSQTEFDAVGETGGTKSVQLTAANLPPHTHTAGNNTHAHKFRFQYQENAPNTGSTPKVTDIDNQGPGIGTTLEATTDSNTHTHTIGNGPGSSQAFSVLSPYMVVYIWRRTA